MQKRLLYIGAFLLSLLTASSTLSAQGLTREQAEQTKRAIIDEWYYDVRQRTDYITKEKAIIRDSTTMRLKFIIYGNRPSDGRSLYISLHGGGGAPKELNDQQWENQWYLYQPKEGVYVCPRAPYDLWNMHFVTGMDQMYRDIILYAWSHLAVNPDKVYILGYSAGGDGVWRLAPRMADSWAAASMMAGHPGDVSLTSLRNLPFMIWCGANDEAYNRNQLCTEKIALLDSLSNTDNGGYIHEGHIVAGKPHWMDRVDTLAISWMPQYRRNPYPHKIAWCQGDELHKYFYWVGVNENEMQKGKEVLLHTDDNTIYIDKSDYTELNLYLNDEIVDLDKPVIVKVNKRQKAEKNHNPKYATIFKGKLQRDAKTMRRTLIEHQDARYIFDAEIHLYRL